MVGSRTGKHIYSQNTFWGQLEKSECELYVSNVSRLNCLTVTVVMWVGTGSLNFSTVGILGRIDHPCQKPSPEAVLTHFCMCMKENGVFTCPDLNFLCVSLFCNLKEKVKSGESSLL